MIGCGQKSTLIRRKGEAMLRNTYLGSIVFRLSVYKHDPLAVFDGLRICNTLRTNNSNFLLYFTACFNPKATNLL